MAGACDAVYRCSVMASSTHRPALVLTLALALALVSCASGASPSLGPIAPATVAVNETARLPLTVLDGGSASLSFAFEGPALPGLERTASISGGSGGGEFRWTPLASHVGTHEVTIVLLGAGGGELDRMPAIVTVTPSADSAPVFLRPGAGGTFDLTRDACVAFDAEVRDEDSPSVTIRARGELPEGASLIEDGPKRARFEWCPSPDQIAATERWTIELEADDGDHPPTPHDFIAVLRSGAKPGCPGEPPVVTIVSPGEGERVEASTGYEVLVTASDDVGLRDAPLLLWTTTAPDDPSSPDVTVFEQLVFSPSGMQWSSRVPPLELEPGAEATVYLVVSATDNDDSTGTACDHRTDTSLRTFTAVAVAAMGDLAACESCNKNLDCASGTCAAVADGGRCLASCAGGATCATGSCQDMVTTGGAVLPACGDVPAACDPPDPGCSEDSFEDNDTLGAASPVTGTVMGQVCADDDDFFEIAIEPGMQLDVSLEFVDADGDLDLSLLSSAGTILASSAGTANVETVGICLTEPGPLFARVVGYRGAENAYSLSVSTSPGACCVDDAGEDDDARASARPVTPGDFDGTICPSDDDYLAFDVAGPSVISALLLFDTAGGDIDLELLGPDGTVVAFSRGTGDEEMFSLDAGAGRYTMRIYGFMGSGGDYVGEFMVTPVMTCAGDASCSIDEVCGDRGCTDRSCTSSGTCPMGYECPVAGPGSPSSECGAACTVNSGCRSSEACKRLVEGRFCGRRGTGQNGDSCATFADCGGQRGCMPWLGGYCARAGCTSSSDCEAGTFCVATGGANICLESCWASDDDCRLAEGYICDIVEAIDTELQFACTPPA